ncbi:MAG: hypothetical protein WCC92_17285 [Candidatus Korobacteraceae bacterium]
MSPVIISLVVFACVFGGAVLGMVIHFRLPDVHLQPNSKEVVRLAMGLVATMVALVLGLLIASAKGFYDTGNAEVTQLAADAILIDRLLIYYGPEAQEARAALRASVAHLLEPRGSTSSPKTRLHVPAGERGTLYDKIQELSPANENQRRLQAQALGFATEIGRTRWLMFAQETTPLPAPLFGMLVFWLTMLFISFGMFVRPNAVVVASLLVSALAIAGAVLLIAGMYQPYGGLIQVSDAPLRAALAQLSQ